MNWFDGAFLTGYVLLSSYLLWRWWRFEKINQWNHAALLTDEYLWAYQAMAKWMEDGKIKQMDMQLLIHHMRDLTIDHKRPKDTFRMLAGPHGWTVYQALLARRKK